MVLTIFQCYEKSRVLNFPLEFAEHSAVAVLLFPVERCRSGFDKEGSYLLFYLKNRRAHSSAG